MAPVYTLGKNRAPVFDSVPIPKPDTLHEE